MPPRVDSPEFRASVRAFVARDWSRVAAQRASYWSDVKRTGGLEVVLRVADQLRAGAVAIDPAWPAEAEREADLETHRRVASLLARVPWSSEKTPRAPASGRRR